jgi:hypothetical protein
VATVTSTGPERLAAGLVAVIEFGEFTVTAEAGLPPKLTVL